MENDQFNYCIQISQSYKNDFVEAYRLASASRSSDSTRLAWYVAICGYVLINGVNFLQSILPMVTPGRIATLLIPWAITATLSVVGHIAISRASGKEDRYYLVKITSLNVFTCNVASGAADKDTLIAIIHDTDPKIKVEKEAMDSINKWRRRWVQAAQIALLVSLLWSVIALYV